VVEEVAVMVREEGGEKRLVGYVVMREGEESRVSELREYLRERLPEYMVPGVYVRLERLPLTPNGKVDRKALPKPGQERGEKVMSSGAPRTPVEEMLGGIFEGVLKLDRVERDDNFFEIGGHSLLATQVASRVKNAFGVEIGISSIFEKPTVEMLARKIEELMSSGGEQEVTPLVRASRNEGLPFGKLSMLDLPIDYRHPVVSNHRGEEKSFSLPVELVQSLKGLSRQEAVTMSMALLAAFKTLLYRYSAQEDIIISTAVASRSRPATVPLIGPFMNMLPLRTNLGGNPRFRELLRRVKGVVLGGYLYQDLPFEKLVKEIKPESGATEMPLFNVAFGLQSAWWEDLSMNDIKIKPQVAEQEITRFDLGLWITEGCEGMDVRWTYHKDRFNEETVIRTHNHFETLLFNIVDRPDTRLLSLKISSGAKNRLSHRELSELEDLNRRKLGSIKRKGIELPIDPA
jgi:hypothetical protein